MGLFFFCFLLLSFPKALPVVTLFDVKEGRTVFPRDFTQAFGFALVLSFITHQ